MGAMLVCVQSNTGQENIISYVSRYLSDVQSGNYKIETEAVAIAWALGNRPLQNSLVRN